MNYTYILQCADGTYYTGWTNNLVKLVYSETFETKSEALKREAAIKRLSRSEKEALIAKQHKEN